MENTKPSGRVSLVAVFIVCWLVATVAVAVLCNFDIYYEPQPHHKIIKDEASFPTRIKILVSPKQVAWLKRDVFI